MLKALKIINKNWYFLHEACQERNCQPIAKNTEDSVVLCRKISIYFFFYYFLINNLQGSHPYYRQCMAAISRLTITFFLIWKFQFIFIFYLHSCLFCELYSLIGVTCSRWMANYLNNRADGHQWFIFWELYNF